MADQAGRAIRPGHLELAGGGGHGRHGRTEEAAQLHGGQAHATSRAEHDEFLARLEGGHGPQDMVGGAVCHAEGRGRAVADGRRDAGDRSGRNGRLLGEGAGDHRPHDPVAGGKVTGGFARLRHDAGELAPGHERRRDADLVPVGYQEYVREVDRRCGDPDPHLACGEGRRRDLLDRYHLRCPYSWQTAARTSAPVTGGPGELGCALHQLEDDGTERLALRAAGGSLVRLLEHDCQLPLRQHNVVVDVVDLQADALA